MERFEFNYTNDSFITALIILTILLFIKTILYYIYLTDIHHIFFTVEQFEKFRHKLSDTLNIFIGIISLLVLFLRKDNTTLAIILALVFLLKAFLHFFINYKFYQYTSLSQSNIDKLKQFYEVEAFATNTLLFIITIYMLNIIFINPNY
jgi:hypothetical protein